MLPTPYIPGVDGLRAIAVMTVVLFHSGFAAFAGGFVGVDVFFVISGFLITGLIVREVESTGRFDFADFYVRRARRLFPALFVTFVACFVLAFLLFTAQHFQRFGGELMYALVSLSNVFFWSESGYFNTVADFKPLLHTWSLSVEEQFYLIWPAAIYLIFRKTGKRGLWLFMLLIAAGSLWLNIRMQNGFDTRLLDGHSWLKARFGDGASTLFFLTPFRLFEFAIGAAMVWIRPSLKLPRAALELTMLAGLALIAYAVYRFNETTVFPSYHALIPCIGAALIILAVDAPVAGLAVRNTLAVFIGKISYSVYLVHWPMLVFYKYWHVTPISPAERAALVVASIAIGYLLYRFVETPFRGRSGRPVRLSRAGVGFTCSSLLLGISLLASTVWANDGLPWRIAPMPPELAAQFGNSKQFHADQWGGAGFTEPTAWIDASPGSPADIVVLGDSHASHYKTGLKEQIADPLRKSIFFSTDSCLILPGMTRLTAGHDWNTSCKATLDAGLAEIGRNPNALVVLGESWIFQIDRAALADSGKPLAQGDGMQAALRRLAPHLDALRAAIGNRRLVIVGDVPGAGAADAAGCFMRPKYIKIDCENILSTNKVDNPSNEVNAFLNKYAESRPNVIFLNPFDALCDGRRCYAFRDGRVLYSDGYHLSKFGSTLAVSAFKSRLLNGTAHRSSLAGAAAPN
ncbi:acyltransferase family protein [Paraburkholderia solisilvae]|uniref:O-acetyltransferase OatA n=1 Tax=Paraburkholderia solisilvae TaxID=624376 RepID=A0A6J5D447_9BURK|nr:acyltransferase family protein [Paraburkholderia solisilvae]CAB3748723.1 hypothetical protein LMG29739_00576 [Paraburkholderia solisilvae]